MAELKELKKIKHIYGEKFARMCRDMFPIILNKDGALLDILEKRFSHNCNSLYEVITENGLEFDFEDLIYREFDMKRDDVREETRTPYEILREEGYDLFECKSEDDIQSFRKYYDEKEVICTIYNGGRLKKRECFFAVKKNVDEIRRENFKNPDKSDEYSTSVLAIQFTRGRMSEVQIISRYNHTVVNPNCTLSNDLDKLAPGLKQSFANLLSERGLNLDVAKVTDFILPGYTRANDGRYYKFNVEINGEYYCPGNIFIKNGEALTLGEPEKGILMDYFYLDLQNKKIRLPDETLKDSFVDTFESVKKVEVVREKKNDSKVVKVYSEDSKEPALIKLNEDNQIIGYVNHELNCVGKNFLRSNTEIRELDLPNLEYECGYFLTWNSSLRELSLPKLKQAMYGFFDRNRVIEKLDLPEIERVSDSFLCFNNALERLSLPNLEYIGNEFFRGNMKLCQLYLPKVQYIGNNFMPNNMVLDRVDLPNLQEAGDDFLRWNTSVESLNMPNLERFGEGFLYRNMRLRHVDLPNLVEAKDGFLNSNQILESVNTPKNQSIEKIFYSLTELNRKRRVEMIREKQEKLKAQEAEITELKNDRKVENSRETRQH